MNQEEVKTMVRKALVVAVLLMILVAHKVWAGVEFRSWNHAVFGGAVRFEGSSKTQRCSARFDAKGVERAVSSGWRYFESKAPLPCDLVDGGRLVVEVNKKPVGFQVPAGVITHGREPYVVIRGVGTPSVVVPLTKREADGTTVVIELYPTARNRKCTMGVYASFSDQESYSAYAARVRSYLKGYLKVDCFV